MLKRGNGKKNKILTDIRKNSTNQAVQLYQSLKPKHWLLHEDRKVHSALIRLRTKHNNLRANLAKFMDRKTEEELDTEQFDPSCRLGCKEAEDETHVLLKCPHFNTARAKLATSLNRLNCHLSLKTLTGLDQKKKAKQIQIRGHVVRFLKETKLMNDL